MKHPNSTNRDSEAQDLQLGHGMKTRLAATLLLVLASTPSWALRSNYRVYASPGSNLISNTSEAEFKLTGQSRGSYRQVSYVSNGTTRYAWVHRYAVTNTDSVAAPTANTVQAPSNLSVRENYNVRTRAGMSSSVLGNTASTDYKLTGRTNGVWREVVSSDGKKGWINRMGVTAATPTPTPTPVPTVASTPTPAPAVATTPVVPATDAKPVTQIPEVKPVTTKPDAVAQVTTKPEVVKEAKPKLPEVPGTVISETDISKPSVTPTILNPGQPEADQTQKLSDMASNPSTTTVVPKPVKPMPVSGSGECNFGDALMKKNCQQVLDKVASGDLPKEATLYSLKTFKETYGNFCGGNTIKEKFRNNCAFFFTDLDGVYQKNGYRSPAYMIDLCAGDANRSGAKSVVHSTYTNRGTGSTASRSTANYSDRDGAKTTLAGVFRTGPLTGFDPYPKSRGKYRNLIGYSESDPNCEGEGNYRNNFLKKCKVLRLSLSRVGGANSGEQKPMHTSPFNSSSGCPSLGPEQNDIMRRLASRGTSLYIAYTKQKSQKANFEAHKTSCTKDPDMIGNNPFVGLASTGNQ